MIKSESEIRQDILKLCDWVEKSYHLPTHLFQNEFAKMLENFEKEMVRAKNSEEYGGLIVGVERTLIGMAERQHLNSPEVMEKVNAFSEKIKEQMKTNIA